MWGKVLAKVGEEGLVYCSAVLPPREAEIVPGRLGWEFLDPEAPGGEEERARAMLQNAIVACCHEARWGGRRPSFAFVREGPYAVPVAPAGGGS
jgi:hypothetical protein